MDQRQTVLRAASPTLEEGREFARYLDTAAEGFFRLWLGRSAVDILAKVFVQPDHDLSYQNVTFAEIDRKIVGMVSGYTAEQHRHSSLRPLKEAMGNWNIRFSFISFLFAPFLRIVDTIGDGDFYLQAVAVDGELRGSGVGSVLMDSIENRAAGSGAARLVLDVSAKNEGARRLYERRGMSIESQWPKRLAIPALKLVRMTKEL